MLLKPKHGKSYSSPIKERSVLLPEPLVWIRVLATESWKRTDLIKSREVASGENLPHCPLLLPFSSLPAAWQGRDSRQLLVENPFKGLGRMGADKEKDTSTFQATISVLKLVPSGSVFWLPAFPSPQDTQPVSSTWLVTDERLLQHRASAATYLQH